MRAEARALARGARDWWERRILRRLGLQALVRRTGNFADVHWLGRPVWQNISDIWSLQETVWECDVDVVVECGTNRGGSAYFLASLFDLRGSGQVITIDVERLTDFTHPRIEFLIGSSIDPAIIRTIRDRLEVLSPAHVLFLLDSDHSAAHVLAELRTYADMVPIGDYLVVQDGVIDELRSFRDGRPGPLIAIRQFLKEDGRFEVDSRRSNRFLFSHSPFGWLRRVE